MSYFPIFIDMTDRQGLVVGAGSGGLISGGADPGLTHRVAKEVRRVLAEAEVEDT